MVEIIALLTLCGIIGKMARRRGRSSSRFGLMLVVCWFGGEILGAVLGYTFFVDSQQGSINLAPIYLLGLAGAVCGAGLAFFLAMRAKPVDGEWLDLDEKAPRQSRIKGAVVGGVGGGVLGALAVWFLYRSDPGAKEMSLMLQGFLAVGLVGALLGLVSGLQTGQSDASGKPKPIG